MFDATIADAAFLYDVPESWIRAFIAVESSFNPDAVSSAGARGLMQIMPATAAGYGVTDLELLFDPAINIDIGTHLLRDLIQAAGGLFLRPVASAYYSGSLTAWETNPDVKEYTDKILAQVKEVVTVGGGLLLLAGFAWLLFYFKKRGG